MKSIKVLKSKHTMFIIYSKDSSSIDHKHAFGDDGDDEDSKNNDVAQSGFLSAIIQDALDRKKLKDQLPKINIEEVKQESDGNMHLTNLKNELKNNSRKEELKINLNVGNSLEPSFKDGDSKVSYINGQPIKPKSENARKRIYSDHLLTPDLPQSLPPMHPRQLSEVNISVVNLDGPPSDGVNENNEEKSIEKPEVIVKR
jgi:hypothetical protein